MTAQAHEGPVTTNGPRYANLERRRAEILDAAVVVFAQHGFTGSSLRSIASEAGTTHQTVLNHFESKIAVFQAVLARRAIRDSEERARCSVSAPMVEIAAMMMRRNAENRNVVLLDVTLRAEALRHDHPAHEFFAALTADFTMRVHGDLQRELANGRVRRDIDLQATARQFTSLVEGLQTQWLYDPSIDMERTVVAFLDSLRPTRA